jgi:mannonate dehydratase
MIQTMRWFGPNDPVTLRHIQQAGATGIVTALHHIPNGQTWSVGEIQKRKQEIESVSVIGSSLNWEVVESVPVHEDIKKGKENFKQWIENYKLTLQNLASEGIKTVCYNFMPVLDWSRTDLELEMPDGSKALYFHYPSFAAFDIFLLKRPGAHLDYSIEVQEEAKALFGSWTDVDKLKISNNVLRGLPGAEEHFTLDNFLNVLNDYKDISPENLQQNLINFLSEVAPVAQSLGINLSIHPDDPPFPLLGLPRIMSTEADLTYMLNQVPIRENGFCFCTGSFGALPENDLPGMVNRQANRMHFIHLRSVKKDLKQPKTFFEADHLGGDADMVDIITEIKKEEFRREKLQLSDYQIPMRPDHGHQMLDDLIKQTNPGYSAIGRLRGLAELRGIEAALQKVLQQTIN